MFVSYVVLDSTNPTLLTSTFVSATFSGGNKIPEKTDNHIQGGLFILTHGCRSFHEQWAGIVLAVRRYSMAEGHGRQKLQTAWQSKARREGRMTEHVLLEYASYSTASSLVRGRDFMSLISIKPWNSPLFYDFSHHLCPLFGHSPSHLSMTFWLATHHPHPSCFKIWKPSIQESSHSQTNQDWPI